MKFFAKEQLFASPKRSKEERRFVRRLDIFLLTFGCISQVIKYLDQQNINNAYVSGMKEDLNLNGDELNYFVTSFNVAYCVMLIPSQIILTYVRPSFWLPGLEVAWGTMTGLMAMTTSAKQVYIIRVFLGAFESSAWPGMMTLFMHWYTPTELAKRMGFFHSSQAVGNMLAGALQAAITRTMDGHSGLAGWRWLFVVNAIITVIWAALGVFMLPDYPNRRNPRAFWFSHNDQKLSLERLLRHQRAQPKVVTWASAKRTFSTWLVYCITILFASTVLATYGYVYFGLFLKALKNANGSKRWTSEQVNVISSVGGGAINLAFVWFWGILSDYLQSRWTLIVAQCVIGLIPSSIMSAWTSNPTSLPIAAAYYAYFMDFVVLATPPLIYAWLADMIPHDPDARSLIVGTSVAVFYSISAWSQVLVWPASQAPYYNYGWQTCLALWLVGIFITCTLRILDIRYLAPQRRAFVPDGEASDPVVAAEHSSGKEKG